MRHFFAKLFFAFSVFILSAQAFADAGMGWHFLPKFMYLIENSTTNGNSTNSSRILLDGGLGYKFNGPVYVGGQYGYDSKSTTGGTTDTETYQGFGPTVGLMGDNVYFLVTYYVYDQHTSQVGGGTTTYGGGSGYQIDLAYFFTVGTGASIGPCLSYRSHHYSSISPGGSIDYTYTTLLPYIAFNFSF